MQIFTFWDFFINGDIPPAQQLGIALKCTKTVLDFFFHLNLCVKSLAVCSVSWKGFSLFLSPLWPAHVLQNFLWFFQMCLSLRSSLTVTLPLLCLFVISVGFSMSKKSPFRSRAFLDALKVPLLPQGGADTTTHLHALSWWLHQHQPFLVSIFELSNSWDMNCDWVTPVGSSTAESPAPVKQIQDKNPAILPPPLSLSLSCLFSVIQTPSFTRKRTMNHLLNCGQASCAVFRVCFRE